MDICKQVDVLSRKDRPGDESTKGAEKRLISGVEDLFDVSVNVLFPHFAAVLQPR